MTDSIIKKIISERKIGVSDVKGQWESRLAQFIDNPFPGMEKALVLAGSDRRGTAWYWPDLGCSHLY